MSTVQFAYLVARSGKDSGMTPWYIIRYHVSMCARRLERHALGLLRRRLPLGRRLGRAPACKGSHCAALGSFRLPAVGHVGLLQRRGQLSCSRGDGLGLPLQCGVRLALGILDDPVGAALHDSGTPRLLQVA